MSLPSGLQARPRMVWPIVAPPPGSRLPVRISNTLLALARPRLLVKLKPVTSLLPSAEAAIRFFRPCDDPARFVFQTSRAVLASQLYIIPSAHKQTRPLPSAVKATPVGVGSRRPPK